jgi:hypothetical protein
LIALSGERLERIGAPNISAERSDWDRVSADFIGLRGFGNVVWYPVSAPPVMLGDGAKLFAEIGRQKLRQQQAQVKMTVTSEYSADCPGSEPGGAQWTSCSGGADGCAGEFVSRRGDGDVAGDCSWFSLRRAFSAQPAKGGVRRSTGICCAGGRAERAELCKAAVRTVLRWRSNGWARSRSLH